MSDSLESLGCSDGVEGGGEGVRLRRHVWDDGRVER